MFLCLPPCIFHQSLPSCFAFLIPAVPKDAVESTRFGDEPTGINKVCLHKIY